MQVKDGLCSGSTSTTFGSPCYQKAYLALKKEQRLALMYDVLVKVFLGRRNQRHPVITHMIILSPEALATGQQVFLLLILPP